MDRVLRPLAVMGNSLSLKRSKSEQGWRRKPSDKRGKFQSIQDLKRSASKQISTNSDKTIDPESNSNRNSLKKSGDSPSQSPPKLKREVSKKSVRRQVSNSSSGGSIRRKGETSGDAANPTNRYSDASGKYAIRTESIDKENSDVSTSNIADSATKRMNSTTNLGSKKKEARMTPAQKDLLKECWETSKHTEFGTRIYTRYFQKRPDIRRVFDEIERTKKDYSWTQESKDFNSFLHTLIEKIDEPETMEDMSRDWGSKYVVLRDYGFKPQFWVPFSEIMTTECLYLDGGVHPVADMIEAWATFITIMLGHMRDGFYSQLRLIRKQSRRRQSTWTNIGLLPQDSDRDSSIIGESIDPSVSIQSGLDNIYTVATSAAFHDIYETPELQSVDSKGGGTFENALDETPKHVIYSSTTAYEPTGPRKGIYSTPVTEGSYANPGLSSSVYEPPARNGSPPKKQVGFSLDHPASDDSTTQDGYSSAYGTPPLTIATPT